jgi:hypothetical protein
MGLSLEFYAGDVATSARAFYAVDLDGLRDGTAAQRHADFSLHLSPTDLDLLSEVMAEHRGVPAHTLHDCVGPSLAEDPGESDAYLVDPMWVKMVAAADLNAAESLAGTWISRVGKEINEPVQLTPEAVSAVQDVIELCRHADTNGVDVVHTWCL